MTYGHLQADCLYTGISSGAQSSVSSTGSLYLVLRVLDSRRNTATPCRRYVATAALKSTFRTTEAVGNIARLKMTGTVSATPEEELYQTNGLGEIPVRLPINN